MLSSHLIPERFVNYFGQFFSKRGKDFMKSLSQVILAMMHCCSCSTWQMASALSTLFDKRFLAGERRIYYLLSNRKFTVDDSLWGCYLKMIFALLAESSYIKMNEKLFIQVDNTTLKDDFIILYASLVLNGKAIPIYFTKRGYPKKKIN